MRYCKRCLGTATQLGVKRFRIHEGERYCPTCYRLVTAPLVVEAHGRRCVETTGQCSACGFSWGGNPDPEDPYSGEMRLYSAKWPDSDGVWMARLCSTGLGEGCLHECPPGDTPRAQVAALVGELAAGDDDAAATEIEDLRQLGVLDMMAADIAEEQAQAERGRAT